MQAPKVYVGNPLQGDPIRVSQDEDVIWLSPKQARVLAAELLKMAAKVEAARDAWKRAA